MSKPNTPKTELSTTGFGTLHDNPFYKGFLRADDPIYSTGWRVGETSLRNSSPSTTPSTSRPEADRSGTQNERG